MNRVDRLVLLITLLRSRSYSSADYLAERFELSLRTIYRDIKALQEIGIPIDHEPNRGYYLLQEYFLPPVQLTNEEANALALMSSLAGGYGDKSVEKNAITAMDKIKGVLSKADRNKLNHLQAQIKVHPYLNKHSSESYLSSIQISITDRTTIHLRYMSGNGVETKREIEPIGLTYYGQDWHIIAWCWLREDYRDFKLSRIIDATSTGESFRKQDHKDIGEYLQSL